MNKAAQSEENDEVEKVEEKLDPINVLKSLGAHLLNYLFVVFFLAISEEEPSNILSFLCVIFAFLLFLKVRLKL